MEYRHRHFLEALAEHKALFDRVGELIKANRGSVVSQWRGEIREFFDTEPNEENPATGLSEEVIDKLISVLVDWNPRKHLEGAHTIGQRLADREIEPDDLVIGYHMLQEILRRLIRDKMAGDFADAWEAMEDYHGHTLAVVVAAYHEAVNERRKQRGIDDQREFLSQLEMARGIQGKLIPQNFQNHYLIATSKLKTVDVIGGDIFYAHQVSESLAFFAIADAEGHGLPAALNMMALSAHFQTVLSNYYTPEYVAEYLNLMIIRGDSGMPPTSGIFLTIDGKSEELRIVNAGHPDPVLIKGEAGTVHLLEHGNLVLGLSKREDYKAVTYKFTSGDKLILFTDGLIDFKTRDGELFGMEGLMDLFEENKYLAGEEILEKVMEYTEREARSGGQRTDDILVVAIDARRAEWRTLRIPRISIPKAKERVLLELNGLQLPHEVISDIHVVMDELIDNALHHGNQGDHELPIIIDYLAGPEEFRIRVTDSGEGFDWHSLDMLMNKDKILSASGRGLYFIRSLMDEVSFSERGNQVTAIKRFDRQ